MYLIYENMKNVANDLSIMLRLFDYFLVIDLFEVVTHYVVCALIMG